MSRFFVAVLAFCLSLFSGVAGAQQFKLLSSWDNNYPDYAHLVEPFAEGIKKASNGRMSITVMGPETVPPFEQLEPVGAGVFDFLFTHGAYHHGTSPLMLLAEALVGDVEVARNANIFNFLDQHYQQFGVKLIMLSITPEGAYHIITRGPVSADGDLKGRKIRGTLTYKGVTDALNASLVVLPASEIYTALEKGVVDGAAWPVVGALDYRWYEVAKYLLRPGFGVKYEPIFMNLNAWNRLSAEDQKMIMDVARKIEEDWYVAVPSIWEKEQAALLEKGMQITELGPEQKAGLQAAFAEGLWKFGMDASPKATQEMRDYAISKGMAK